MFTVLIRLANHILANRKKRRFYRICTVGENLKVSKISNCMIKKISGISGGNITIGDNCEIHGELYCEGAGRLVIGNNTTIRYQSFIGCVDSIIIGNDVIISNNIKIIDSNNHPTSPKERRALCESCDFNSEQWAWSYSQHNPVIIEDNVWVGENSRVLKGVTIGRGSIVACCSVVTKDVPPYSIVAGNPAIVVKSLQDN